MKKITFSLLLFCAFVAHSETTERLHWQHVQKYPQAIEAFLSENLYQLSADELHTLINAYQRLPQHNQRLLLFAKGRMAFLQQDYAMASTLYRTVLA